MSGRPRAEVIPTMLQQRRGVALSVPHLHAAGRAVGDAPDDVHWHGTALGNGVQHLRWGHQQQLVVLTAGQSQGRPGVRKRHL